jgi:hypothetical protein
VRALLLATIIKFVIRIEDAGAGCACRWRSRLPRVPAGAGYVRSMRKEIFEPAKA